MKLQDTHTNGTNCCQTQEEVHPTGCCREQETDNPEGCCCSRETETDHPTGCCKEPHGEAPNGQSSNGDHEKAEPNHDVNALAQLQALLATANDKYIRLYSEFENFKKRASKERIALTDKANEQTLKELLPIVDDFERGIAALQGEHEGTQFAIQEGIKLIHHKLCSFLQRFSIKEMELEQGSEFNADLHEAIMRQPTEQLEMKGKIISVVEKGYLLNESVLRVAKVVIGV